MATKVPWLDGTVEEIAERLRAEMARSDTPGIEFADAVGMIAGLADYHGWTDTRRLKRIRMVLAALDAVHEREEGTE